ncbi:hypothetical protein FRB99_004531 [Tulasnella sp. 403]|nr:hypothetical protein FRB99_004531 [Tulasnella sp. 403]
MLLAIISDDPVDDARAETLDQLKEKPFWWIAEYIPFKQYHQDADGYWHKRFYWNKGRPREIQDPKPLFHESVRIRQENYEGYTPRAKLLKGVTPEYVLR